MTLTWAIALYAALHLAKYLYAVRCKSYPRRCSPWALGLGVWAGIELVG